MPDDHYYNAGDLKKFSDIGKNCPDLADKFFAWYNAVFAEGALSERENALIALPLLAKMTRLTPPRRAAS